MAKLMSSRWFNLASWGVTAVIVAGLLGFVFLRTLKPAVVATPAATAASSTDPQPTDPAAAVSFLQQPAIERRLTLKTIIPARPRFDPLVKTVQRGDSVTALAKKFGISADTLLFANYDTLQDNPDGLRAGQELNIPPTDGILYQWKDGDTVESIAAKFDAKADDILNWPGNNIDLTAPTIKTGQWIMVPGGSRASLAQTIQTASSGGGTLASGCAPGAVGRGFFSWPANNHFLSGNDYSSAHQGIDIAANEGNAVYAADSGVVSMSQDGWNYGYGSVIQIDHGKGFVTLYAHLSLRIVQMCQSVFGGQMIGSAGNTGNSFGAHLHFEIRLNGAHVNPWSYLPPP